MILLAIITDFKNISDSYSDGYIKSTL